MIKVISFSILFKYFQILNSLSTLITYLSIIADLIILIWFRSNDFNILAYSFKSKILANLLLLNSLHSTMTLKYIRYTNLIILIIIINHNILDLSIHLNF